MLPLKCRQSGQGQGWGSSHPLQVNADEHQALPPPLQALLIAPILLRRGVLPYIDANVRSIAAPTVSLSRCPCQISTCIVLAAVQMQLPLPIW